MTSEMVVTSEMILTSEVVPPIREDTRSLTSISFTGDMGRGAGTYVTLWERVSDVW